MSIFRNISRHFRAWRIAKLLPDAYQLYYASIMAYAKRTSSSPSTFAREGGLSHSSSSSSSSSSSPFAILQQHPHFQQTQEYLLSPVCQILNYGTLLPLPSSVHNSSSSSSASINVRTSTIPNAGFGLFSTRTIYRGEIVALYPGILHGRNETSGKFYGESMGIFDRSDDATLEEEEIRKKTNVGTSNYVLRRVDGICVDAGDYVNADAIDKLTTKFSPYALAHFANHPPKDASPSVIEVSINIPVQSRFQGDKQLPTYVSASQIDKWLTEGQNLSFIPLQKRSRIPYSWAPLPLWSNDESRDSSSSSSGKLFEPRDNESEESNQIIHINNQTYSIPTQGTIPVTLFIAIDNIQKDQEIFFDYSYLPGSTTNPLPFWYNLVPPSKQWQLLHDACQEAGISLPDYYPKVPLAEIDKIWYERLQIKE